MSMNEELVRMATISNIMLLRERLGYDHLSFEVLNEMSDDRLRESRDKLIVKYNALVAPKHRMNRPDGCIVEADGTVKSDVIMQEGDE